MSKRFEIITLGCKVNQYESAFMLDRLREAGWSRVEKGRNRDVTIVNTCIVTQRASHQSRQAIRKAIRENPGTLVVAVGCYAQVYPEVLSQIEGIGLIVGNTAKARVPELLLAGVHGQEPSVQVPGFEPGMPFDVMRIGRFPDRTRAFLKIQDGCESYCSYCIVAFARGPYRSLPPHHVLSMVEALSEKGYKEVVLTGIHLGKYGIETGGAMNLARLLRRIGREKFPIRIRLSSIEPHELDNELIDLVATEPWLCRHFHVPLQSGDDRILRKMNRRYTARAFAHRIRSIHEQIPLAAVGVDVMAGFPGEDEQAHENSFALIRDLPVSYLHVFPYSNRPGTAASAMSGQTDTRTIKRRAGSLRALGEKKRTAFYRRCLGRSFVVLAERWSEDDRKTLEGMTDNYLPMLFPSTEDRRNHLVEVRADRIHHGHVMGTSLHPYD